MFAALAPLAGSLISGAMGLFGASSKGEATERANAQNLAMQREVNETNKEQAELNRQMQYEFAKSGIKWRVDDAKAAGIHPLYALGGSGASYSPVSLSQGVTPVAADTSMGSAVANMGQDISRAINATRSGSEREDAVVKTATTLQLQNMKLRNDLLASQIAKINQAGGNPPLPALVPTKDPEETGPIWSGDGGVMPPQTMSPAQAVEDEYGEAVGDVHGFFRWLNMMKDQTALGRGFHSWADWMGNNLRQQQMQEKSRRDYRSSHSWRGHF